MARAQSFFLRIFDIGGTTYQRWQSYYEEKTVSFQQQNWSYIPFAVDGFIAGVSGDESSITVTAPATTNVMQALDDAIIKGRLIEIKSYVFNSLTNNSTPQPGQALLASFTGQAVGGGNSLTSVTVNLGSALSPIGAQMPPRKFTTSIMGKGARL
jgi:hypothetical protein